MVSFIAEKNKTLSKKMSTQSTIESSWDDVCSPVRAILCSSSGHSYAPDESIIRDWLVDTEFQINKSKYSSDEGKGNRQETILKIVASMDSKFRTDCARFLEAKRKEAQCLEYVFDMTEALILRTLTNYSK